MMNFSQPPPTFQPNVANYRHRPVNPNTSYRNSQHDPYVEGGQRFRYPAPYPTDNCLVQFPKGGGQLPPPRQSHPNIPHNLTVRPHHISDTSQTFVRPHHPPNTQTVLLPDTSQTFVRPIHTNNSQTALLSDTSQTLVRPHHSTPTVHLVHPQQGVSVMTGGHPSPIYQSYNPYSNSGGYILVQKSSESCHMYPQQTPQWTLPPSPSVPFPPPNLSHPPPPIVSPTLRPQPPPRYETPPKTPISSGSGQVFLSPPPPYSNPMVPVYPVPSAQLQSSQPDQIPDLRHQFLNNQLLPQAGQVVLLPPLPPDKSVQTIQLLTPGSSGQFQVQTIVLPIIKVDNHIVPDKPKEDDHKTDYLESSEVLLNQIDSTGLPSVMSGVDLEQVRRFASEFKTTRLSLGLTQSQVGQSLQSDDQSVSQSTICRFEKLEITANQVKKLLPQLQRWLAETQARHSAGLPLIPPEDSSDLASKEMKKRKKRTVFNQETLAALTEEFLASPSPSTEKITELSDRLDLDREIVRVWFCNKRQQNRKTSKS